VSAYNFVLVCVCCPACGKEAPLLCQTHVASSFDGDETGRFCDRSYNLYERMVWWPREDPRFEDWPRAEHSELRDPRLLDAIGPPEPPDDAYEAAEACYARCELCGCDELFAVIAFRNVAAVAVLAAGWETDWPRGYPR
jgi:hypothetical protein